jgi:hypothetical protein
MQLVFDGDTFAEALASVRRFLADLPGDAAAQGLLSLDGPLPPAVKKTSAKKGEEPTEAQKEAALDAQARPCSRDEVKAALRAYVDACGPDRAPELLGAPNLSAVPEEKLWRALQALKAATPASNAFD